MLERHQYRWIQLVLCFDVAADTLCIATIKVAIGNEKTFLFPTVLIIKGLGKMPSKHTILHAFAVVTEVVDAKDK